MDDRGAGAGYRHGRGPGLTCTRAFRSRRSAAATGTMEQKPARSRSTRTTGRRTGTGTTARAARMGVRGGARPRAFTETRAERINPHVPELPAVPRQRGGPKNPSGRAGLVGPEGDSNVPPGPTVDGAAMDALLPGNYAAILTDLKARVRAAQIRAATSVNRELVALYLDIGRSLAEQDTCWGTKVVERLASDLKAAFPETLSSRCLARQRPRRRLRVRVRTKLNPRFRKPAFPDART